YWAQDHTEIKVSSFFDTGRGFVAPNLTTAFTPRTISGNGITGTVGRDGTVSTITITGITAGSEVLQSGLSATGGATVILVDSGRGGIAYVDVIPNGADPVITATQTVWQRSLSATVNGVPANVNGAASVNVDATRAVNFRLTLPANHLLTAAPTVTGGTLASWNVDGIGTITPNNTENITITASSATPNPKSARLAFNAGTWVTFGTIQFTMATGGNRSFLVRSASGTISVVLHSWTGWDSTSSPYSTSLTTSSTQYFNSSYNYGNAGNNQFFYAEDTTNNRRYEGMATVGSSYNNNVLWIKEVT
ncbi:MAG: hypothetical protein ACRC62_10610, partial [Microcoleus sp.]